MTAKDWDQAYRDEDTPWNKGKTAPPLMEWVNQNEIDGEVLVLGCGEGHDVRFLANHCNSVTGMDISETAIGLAKKHSTLNNVQYICQDFFNDSISSTVRYDWIFEHTFFCAIEPCLRKAYRDQVGKLLKPNGHLLGVFFIADEHYELNQGPPYKVSKNYLLEFFGEKFEIIEAYVPNETYACRPYGSELVLTMKVQSR
jgi:SAM-dependent methyltransferase